MIKKLLAVLLVVTLIISLASCGQKPQGQAGKIILITDSSGLEDESINDFAYAGLKKAKEELDVEIDVLQSSNADNYATNLTNATGKNANLVISVGYLMAEDTKKIAEKNPEQKYAIVEDTSIELPNVSGLAFKENEGSFLVGVIAGLTTKSNVVGFIGGVKKPMIEKYEYGFRAGVKSVNPNAEVLVEYTGVFDDPTIGKEKALAQNKLGADVIYHASGACGYGIVEAAGEQEFWVIGYDSDQSYLNPQRVLCSMIKKIDVATYKVTQAVVKDEFTGENMIFGIAEGGVGYSDSAGNIPEDIKEVTDKYKEAIKAGEFEVPMNKSTFDAFKGYSVE